MKTDNCSNKGNTAGETDAVNGHGAACCGGVGKDNEVIGAGDTGGYARRMLLLFNKNMVKPNRIKPAIGENRVQEALSKRQE